MERLIFTHHGVEILADFAGELKKAQAAMPGKVHFMNDADQIYSGRAERIVQPHLRRVRPNAAMPMRAAAHRDRHRHR